MADLAQHTNCKLTKSLFLASRVWLNLHSAVATRDNHVAHGQSDNLGRYYTRASVASVMVGAIDLEDPKIIIDLGSGAGTLISQAAKRWENASYLTVDIDYNAASSHFPARLGHSYQHLVGDALNRNLKNLFPIPRGGACVALCNPPFIQPTWQEHFRELLEEVGLESVLPNARTLPADILFVAQSLRLLKQGGVLGLILPDGLIAGETFARFRNALVEHHSIQQVVELPRNIFRKTEAKAHILVLRRSERQEREILVRCLRENGELSEPIRVSPELAKERLDYSFHAGSAKPKSSSQVGIGALIKDVARGSYSSKTRKETSISVFHTSDLSPSCQNMVPTRFCLPIDTQTGTALTALPGDVLVARVGRGLSEKVCIVLQGKVVPSDCFLRIRPRAGASKQLLELLTSPLGKQALDRIVHGVGAQFITIKALKSLLI